MAANGIQEEYLFPKCFRFCSTGGTLGWVKTTTKQLSLVHGVHVTLQCSCDVTV